MKNRGLKITGIILLVVLTTWVITKGPSRLAVWFKAKSAFMDSRNSISSDEDSVAFITMGIGYNMAEERVNSLLSFAYETMPHLYDQDGKWDGYINIYSCRYGPAWNPPMSDEDRYLYSECFWVYFSTDGLAQKISRYLYVDGLGGSGCTVDLETGTVVVD